MDRKVRQGIRALTGASILGSVIAFPLLASANAAIMACVNPAGQTRLLQNGESCLPQEQLVLWDVQGPAGPAGPQGPPGASAPMVIDSTGAEMGLYTGGQTLMSVGGHRFNLNVLRDGFSSPSFGAFFQYLTPDCSGTRYGSASGIGVVPNGIVLGQQAWFVDYGGTSITLQPSATIYSQQTTSAGPIGPCFGNPVFATTTLLPWTSVNVGSFVPPFTLSN